MKQLQRHNRRSGFSLIELVVTMTILAILVGVVSFRSASVVDRGRVTKVLSLVDTLRSACALYHADTGAYAREYTNYAPNNRRLSAQQTVNGWSGPYIEAPLAHNTSNPFGNLHLYDNPLANNWIPGFDLDGDNTVDVTSGANMLWLSGVDQEAAEKIDEALDGNLQGTWTDAGRVRYSPASRYCWVLIYH